MLGITQHLINVLEHWVLCDILCHPVDWAGGIVFGLFIHLCACMHMYAFGWRDSTTGLVLTSSHCWITKAIGRMRIKISQNVLYIMTIYGLSCSGFDISYRLWFLWRWLEVSRRLLKLTFKVLVLKLDLCLEETTLETNLFKCGWWPEVPVTGSSVTYLIF